MKGMEMLAVIGAGAIAVGIIAIVVSLISIAAAIILLCLSIKEKGELKLRGIDEARIKKIVTLSIWSLVITIISCSGCAFLVLPILALVFANSNARSALQVGNMAEAAKKADLALLMLIISNSVVLGMSALSTITNIITSVIESI